MSTKAAFVVVQNAIAAPDDAWPQIRANLSTVLHHYHAAQLRLPLLSPQENVIIEEMGTNYLIRLELTTLRGIQQQWNYRWLDQLFDVALNSHARVEWYPTDGRRPNLNRWYLDGIEVLVVIKTPHDPVLYHHFIETAWEMSIDVVRIDPETHEVSRMKPARKEGNNGH